MRKNRHQEVHRLGAVWGVDHLNNIDTRCYHVSLNEHFDERPPDNKYYKDEKQTSDHSIEVLWRPLSFGHAAYRIPSLLKAHVQI